MALIAIVMSVFLLVALFVSVDSIWSEGQSEVESSGNFFSECINEILKDERTECSLFGDDEPDGG